jgi:hypothetical protein
MSRAFPPRPECDRIPTNTEIPLDTHPMMPKDTSGGPGAGGPDQIPSPGPPMAEAVPEPTEPPAVTSLGAGGGGIGQIVQAVEDGEDGEVSVKEIILKADISASPNFEQIGEEPFDLVYFKLS